MAQGNEPIPRYAFPTMAAGTVCLSLGIWLCAYLIGESTKEEKFARAQDQKEFAPMYWLQPGSQSLADQIFGAFAYSDLKDRRQFYIRSRKIEYERPGSVCFATFICLGGFVAQFIGLRGLHSLVTLLQLLCCRPSHVYRPLRLQNI
jgi:hypothetical protein